MHSNGEFADVDASLQNRNAAIQADNEQDRQEVLGHLLITNSIPVIKVICHTLSPSYKQQTRTSNKLSLPAAVLTIVCRPNVQNLLNWNPD